MKISLVVSTRDNLKYLKWSYNSIRKNQGKHEVWICYGIDHCTDGTQEWITEIQRIDPKVKSIENTTGCRVGHTIMYDRIINEIVDTDLAMIFHSDMYLCPGALDAIEGLMYDWGTWEDNQDILVAQTNRIVSLTRIEPPLHPAGPEKIVIDGPLGTTEPEDFEKEEEVFLDFLKTNIEKRKYWPNEERVTNGVFAPWAFWVDEFNDIGGHDSLYAPQSKEDSDIFNRFKLNGFEFIQTWKGFVYHLTCRGSRFNPNLTNIGKNSNEWEEQNIRSTKNFIRKWGCMVQHDEYLHPIVPPKYKTTFKIKYSNDNLIDALEPWCDYLDCDLDVDRIDLFINNEQPNTKFDLDLKFYGKPDVEGIIVNIDGRTFNNQDYQNIRLLSQIIEQNEEIGKFELGNLIIEVLDLTHYEKDLIVCQNK